MAVQREEGSDSGRVDQERKPELRQKDGPHVGLDLGRSRQDERNVVGRSSAVVEKGRVGTAGRG